MRLDIYFRELSRTAIRRVRSLNRAKVVCRSQQRRELSLIILNYSLRCSLQLLHAANKSPSAALQHVKDRRPFSSHSRRPFVNFYLL